MQREDGVEAIRLAPLFQSPHDVQIQGLRLAEAAELAIRVGQVLGGLYAGIPITPQRPCGQLPHLQGRLLHLSEFPLRELPLRTRLQTLEFLHRIGKE